MKKILLIATILILLTGCKTKKTNGPTNKPNLNLEIVNTEECDKEVREYINIDDRQVYTVCISEIFLIDEDITLSSHIKNTSNLDNSIEELTSNMSIEDIYKDGGTKVYRNSNMTIIVCNAMLDSGKTNKDIYIGDRNLELEDNFCKRVPEK